MVKMLADGEFTAELTAASCDCRPPTWAMISWSFATKSAIVCAETNNGERRNINPMPAENNFLLMDMFLRVMQRL